MNYQNIYQQLVDHAQSRTKKIYKPHNHHIIPRSMNPEYVDEPWNTVALSRREHLIAHYLLAKMMKTNKFFDKAILGLHSLIVAPWNKRYIKPYMKRFKDKHIPEVVSRQNKGRVFSKEHREKIGATKKGNKNFLGKTHTEENKQASSLRMIGNTLFKGRKHSQKAKDLISKARKLYFKNKKGEK